MIPKDITNEHYELQCTILLGYRGSHVHGTFLPKKDPDCIDDIDVHGICIPPIDHYYGLKNFGSKGTKEIKKNEWDIVLFEFTKAIQLMRKGNPNILQLLWLKPNQYMHISPLGQMLIDKRNIFMGKHIHQNFAGYARGQFHRMTHSACKGYMGKKRKELVERFGYDTKNAAHLIRLLRMSIEVMNQGVIYPTRPEADMLKDIKRGEWSLEDIKTEAERLFILAEEAYVRSDLPHNSDYEAIDELCHQIAKKYFDLAQNTL
jgi:predicted nucleotidyltransferase